MWHALKFDAVQKIGYNGILECYEQGNELLNGYTAQLVSVHDPDEYLAATGGEGDEQERYRHVLDAYEALFELKGKDKVKAVGVGAKDWTVIRRLYADVKFDWVMIANSMTVHSHPQELIEFMQRLEADGVAVINSAVFNGGFLTGGDFYNYKAVDAESDGGKALLAWRNRFFALCKRFNVDPAKAAMDFGLAAPGVHSIAISSGNPQRITANMEMLEGGTPDGFWEAMADEGLIRGKSGLETRR